MRFRYLALLASMFVGAPLLSACDDNGLLGTLLLSPDTAVIGLPGGTVAEGSAIDIVRSAGDFDLVRNPELVTDAEQWDLALRRTPTGLAFLPFTPVASSLRGAGIATTTRAFDAIDKAPRGNSSYSSQPVAVTAGGVYLLRSRQFSTSGLLCVKYARLRVVEVNEAAGTVRFAIVINEGCDDERLKND